MRFLIVSFLILLVFVCGCGVSFVPVNQSESYVNVSNSSVSSSLYFIAKNGGFRDVSCVAVLNLSLGGVSNISRFDVGIVDGFSEKLVRIDFELFDGDSGFSLSPDCVSN